MKFDGSRDDPTMFIPINRGNGAPSERQYTVWAKKYSPGIF